MRNYWLGAAAVVVVFVGAIARADGGATRAPGAEKPAAPAESATPGGDGAGGSGADGSGAKPGWKARVKQPPPRYSSGPNRQVGFPTGIYDENADAESDIRAAAARAKASNKRVLIMWGENQCGFCAYLSDLLWYESPACRALIESEYEVVKVDILLRPPGADPVKGPKGTFSKNIEVARRLGAAMGAQMTDAPRLTVYDPVRDAGVQTLSGKDMVAKPMTMERVFDEQVVVNFLEANRPPAAVAAERIGEGLRKATFDEKRVLVLFTMDPGYGGLSCPDCLRWEVLFERPRVREALEKALVLVRVDAARMTGGQSIMERATGDTKAMAPAVVGLDDRGAALEPAAVVRGFPTDAAGAALAAKTITSAAGAKGSSQLESVLREEIAAVIEESREEGPKGK